MKRLRRDLIVHSDGGKVELVDTLLERVIAVPTELSALPEPGGVIADLALARWLASELLDESSVIDGIRTAGWAARARRTVRVPDLDEAAGSWHLAAELPQWVTPVWRQPERWRRLAEQRAAGTRLLRLDGFVEREVALQWRDVVRGAALQPCQNPYATGLWDQNTPVLPQWRAALTSGSLQALLGAAAGVKLPSTIQINAWNLSPGDQMALHADGTRYAATVSLGLSEAWAAHKGGAIAFGWPTADGLAIQERWLPHTGDVLLFAVEATLWHAVERVNAAERMTLTGQYVLGAGVGS
ncbi:MAG: 2OG-Fe(II) oxygenase [Myxococcales bacterium]|nr:2OG-Fe(II) oxygenase [Myxococcales bacterium]